MRNSLVALGFAGALAFSSIGSAFAHECYIVSRSDAGNLHVTASSRWVAIASLSDLFVVAPQFLGLAPLSPNQIAWAVQAAQKAGMPNDLVVFEGHTLMTNPKTGADTPAAERHGADGKGIDHFIDVFLAIYQQAIQQPA